MQFISCSSFEGGTSGKATTLKNKKHIKRLHYMVLWEIQYEGGWNRLGHVLLA